MKKVILSTPLIVEEGTFIVKVITLDEAREWVGDADNFCGHQTVKVLGIDPANTRGTCYSYDEALALKPNDRLEFGKEYTAEEVFAIGVTPFLISKV